MKIITLRSQIQNVAHRWKQQYGSDKIDILRKLEAINTKTATPKDIEDIIGNTSWVCPQYCHECAKDSIAIVELGEVLDYDSASMCICKGCLKKALKLFKT